jgi:hypothetical protein
VIGRKGGERESEWEGEIGRESSVSKIEYDIRVPSVVIGIEDEI